LHPCKEVKPGNGISLRVWGLGLTAAASLGLLCLPAAQAGGFDNSVMVAQGAPLDAGESSGTGRLPPARAHEGIAGERAAVPVAQAPVGSTPQDAAAIQQELQAARAQVRANPADANARLRLAELLKRVGRHREAAQEYLEVVDLEPSNYAAFHMLSVISADPAQLDEGIARLEKLKEEKPKELMLRVALSELMEKRGNYYQAARVLVDLVYDNAVPDKYHAKINARIHYLLTKSKDVQAKAGGYIAEDELDSSPPPLPESSLRKDLAASKLKESRVMKGVGNAPLLP